MERSDIEEIISRRLCSVETAIPAKVKAVNSDGTLSVVALIKKVSLDGIVDVDNMVIDGVKPFVIGNGSACIEFGIGKDAQVLLVGLSRHARDWLNSSSDDPVIPKSPLGFKMNDLVAVPLTRGDRKNGAKSSIRLGKDGDVEISSKYGQSIVFKDDGSIEMSPKSGKTIKMKGGLDVDGAVNAGGKIHSDMTVEGTDFNTASLSFLSHVHNCAAAGSPSGPAISPPPVSAPDV